MTQENELDINNQKQNKGKLTHFNEAGEAHMVDVHAKDKGKWRRIQGGIYGHS